MPIKSLPTPDGTKLLDLNRAARALDVSEAQAQDLVATGKLRAFNAGGSFLAFRRCDIEMCKGRLASRSLSESFSWVGIGVPTTIRKMVAGDGIEPPTQGFSVLCSTD
jgi:hypothetical protein